MGPGNGVSAEGGGGVERHRRAGFWRGELGHRDLRFKTREGK